VPVALLGHPLARQLPKLLVNQRQQPFRHAMAATLSFVQQAGDLRFVRVRIAW
jgi:hypothetical protein